MEIISHTDKSTVTIAKTIDKYKVFRLSQAPSIPFALKSVRKTNLVPYIAYI